MTPGGGRTLRPLPGVRRCSPLALRSLLLPALTSPSPPAGEPCPENGRSPGSVSTQHSSPRSDSTHANSAQAAGGAAPASDRAAANAQPSDVVISRKESEGFGFVIISSLNRPEAAAAAAAANGESSSLFIGGWMKPGAFSRRRCEDRRRSYAREASALLLWCLQLYGPSHELSLSRPRLAHACC